MAGGTVIGRQGRWLAGVVGLLATGLTLMAGGQAEAGAPTFKLKSIGSFHDPVHVAEAPGADDLTFVVSQSGKIRVLQDEEKTKKPFLDIRDIVQSGGEEGLLSMAFDPEYDENRRFYVYFTNDDGDVEIDLFERRENNPLRADPSSREEIITVQHDQASNHNGGQLQFGPDDYLYAGIGDGGPQMDPEDDAQDIDSLLGKLIRIAPLSTGDYAVPGDNPYVGVSGADEIYALGLRNPWRFSFDSQNGALTIGDVGGGAREEIDYVAGPNAGLGANFGWNDYEGLVETAFGVGANASPHTEPIADFDHGDDGFCAISGGYVVHDPGLPAIEGQYVFADLCDNRIRTLDVPAGDPGTNLKLKLGSPVSFGEGTNGQIYVADLGGGVYRLEQR